MINPRKRQITAIIGVIVAAVVAVVFYYNIDPGAGSLMPRCSFKVLTGYECPGCGLQRALHASLHGDFAEAWRLNPFLFFIVPVGLGYLAVELSGQPLPKLRRVMFSPIALGALIAVTLIWWIVRNFPET